MPKRHVITADEITSGIPSSVWGFATRRVTNIDDTRAGKIDTISTIDTKADTLLTRLTATRAGYLDKIPNVKDMLEYLSNAVSEVVAASDDLTVHGITPPDLTAYTIHKVTLVCIMHAANPIAAAQTVDLKVYGEKAGVGYAQLGNTLTASLQMSATQYSPDGFSWAIDVTSLVNVLNGVQQYNFKFNVTLLAAQNTRFTHQFMLVVYLGV